MRNSYYDNEVFIFMHFWHISEKKILLIASLWNWGFSEELGNCLLIVKPVNTLVSFGVLLRLCLFLILLNCNVTVSCCESNLSTPKIKKIHSCFNSLAFRDLSSTLKKFLGFNTVWTEFVPVSELKLGS